MSASKLVVRAAVSGMALIGALSATAAAAAARPQVSANGMAQTPQKLAGKLLLYSQLDSPGTLATNSQNFEAANDAFDNELADDFVVTGAGWSIDTVSVVGVYFNGPGPAPTVHVAFYESSGASPGAAIPTCNYPAVVPGGAGASFTLPLTPLCNLAPGTYWLSVVANMDFTPGGQWGWTDRTVTSNSPAAWRNPGGGFGVPACVTFGSRGATCGIDPPAPDQLFSLSGNMMPVELIDIGVD